MTTGTPGPVVEEMGQFLRIGPEEFTYLRSNRVAKLEDFGLKYGYKKAGSFVPHILAH